MGQLYYYRIKTRTQQSIIGEPSPIQEGRLASHHLGIIVVDATSDGPGLPGFPNDQEVDDFYENILSPYYITDHWDKIDSINVGVTISDADLAPYQLVFIHIDALNSSIWSDTTALRKYLANGGTFLISGWRLSYSIQGCIGYEHSFAPGDFIYDLAGVDSIIVEVPPLAEFIGASGASGYPDLDFDEAQFPQWGGGLVLADAICTNSFHSGVTVIADFVSE